MPTQQVTHWRCDSSCDLQGLGVEAEVTDSTYLVVGTHEDLVRAIPTFAAQEI